MRWFFHLEGETIVMQARIEAGGAIGDAIRRLNDGDDLGFDGVTFAMLRKAESGVIEVSDDGSAAILPVA